MFTIKNFSPFNGMDYEAFSCKSFAKIYHGEATTMSRDLTQSTGPMECYKLVLDDGREIIVSHVAYIENLEGKTIDTIRARKAVHDKDDKSQP